jgi:hypothetical protein
VIDGLVATSGPTSAGNGCARYLRQQARDCEDARLREQACWKYPVGHSEIARRAFEEERHLVIDPALGVAFQSSGEAPGAAARLAATPSATDLLALRRYPRHCRASTGLWILAGTVRRRRLEKPLIQHDACHPSIAITPSRSGGLKTGPVSLKRASGRVSHAGC